MLISLFDKIELDFVNCKYDKKSRIVKMNKERPIIIKCYIDPYSSPIPQIMFNQMQEVKVQLSNGEKIKLYTFYPDEITINESELIGLTVDRAKRLKFEKDVRSLQY